MPGEWLAQLPDDLKENETLTTFDTLGDLAKSHVETVGRVSELDGKATEYEGKITDLETRFANTIPRLTEESTDEEKAAYYKALGVPEDPTEYEFPKTDGIEHDENMLTWARQTFKDANLNTEQAAKVSQAWDAFMGKMDEANEKAVVDGIKGAETTLKEKWKADYDKNIAFTEKGYQAFEKIAPGFKELIDNTEVSAGIKLGNHPIMSEVFHAIGKAVGDDFSFPGSKPPGVPPDKTGGLQSIYKTPNPPSV